MNELYEELRYNGLDHYEAMEIADPYYTYTNYVPAKPVKDGWWQVALGLAMMFLCMALTIGGL